MAGEGSSPKRLAFFKSDENAGIAGSRGEVATAVHIPKELVLLLLQLIRPPQPLLVLTRCVQIEQTTDNKGVVIEETKNRLRTVHK